MTWMDLALGWAAVGLLAGVILVSLWCIWHR